MNHHRTPWDQCSHGVLMTSPAVQFVFCSCSKLKAYQPLLKQSSRWSQAKRVRASRSGHPAEAERAVHHWWAGGGHPNEEPALGKMSERRACGEARIRDLWSSRVLHGHIMAYTMRIRSYWPPLLGAKMGRTFGATGGDCSGPLPVRSTDRHLRRSFQVLLSTSHEEGHVRTLKGKEGRREGGREGRSCCFIHQLRRGEDHQLTHLEAQKSQIANFGSSNNLKTIMTLELGAVHLVEHHRTSLIVVWLCTVIACTGTLYLP